MDIVLLSENLKIAEFASRFTFLEIMQVSKNVVLKTSYSGEPCVVKIYNASEGLDYEYEILEYLQYSSEHSYLFPKPIRCADINASVKLASRESPHGFLELRIRRLIAYQYFRGTPRPRCSLHGCNYGVVTKIIHDIRIYLDELHRLDMCHGDLHMGNILLGDGGNFILIDYGKAHFPGRDTLEVIRASKPTTATVYTFEDGRTKYVVYDKSLARPSLAKEEWKQEECSILAQTVHGDYCCCYDSY